MRNMPEQIAALKDKDDGKPVHMVNLLSFKEKAVYEDGRETTLTGYEAYGLYGEVVSKLIAERGGKILFSAAVAGMVVGEVENVWDAIAIAEYPSFDTFLDMISSQEWLSAEEHRKAGLNGQLNIATKSS
tara:strand:- start:620 stop:1009 length:390 start_codon:yes stop_codon:yes gene_type:complete